MRNSLFFRCMTLGFGFFAPALASAQAPALPTADIEHFSGILFYCKPLANEAWTQSVCGEMNLEMTSWAARVKKPIALLRTTDGQEQNNERAKAAGFDPKHGLWVLLTISQSKTHTRVWDISARADGISSKQSAQAVPQTTTYMKNDILGAGATNSEAAARAKRTLGVVMNALAIPMRPL